jgi:hypothetical protein
MSDARRAGLGRTLQVLGLCVLPAALAYGLYGGDIFDELLLFGAGTGLILMGRSLAAPSGPQ